jgi:hypothetical protein
MTTVSKIIRRRKSTTTYTNWSMRKTNIKQKYAKEKNFCSFLYC